MNILFLIAEFAPVNTSGNFRSLKFVKYLPATGINPVVVTLPIEEAAKRFSAKIDNDLLKDVPESVTIYRIRTNFKYEVRKSKFRNFVRIFFRLVDEIGKDWKDNLLSSMEEIINKHKIEAVFTSLPPFSMGLLARTVAKKYKLPLLVDMRDLWSHWGSDPHPSYIHFLLAKHLERKVFKDASLVFCVTPQLASIFHKTHPRINEHKFKVLTNGFDMELEAIDNKKENNREKEKFIIGYTGSFYYKPMLIQPFKGIGRLNNIRRSLHYSPSKEDWLYRSPYFFLKALSFLLQLEPALKDCVQFVYIGNEPSWLKAMVAEFGLQNIYYSYGFRTAKETTDLQKTFDAYLATSEKVKGSEHYCLPSKLFDYVNRGKPILGFVTEGIQKDFLIKSGMGVICNPDKIEESARTLKSLLNGNGLRLSRNDEYLKKFMRKNIAQQFSFIVKEKVGTENILS